MIVFQILNVTGLYQSWVVASFRGNVLMAGELTDVQPSIARLKLKPVYLTSGRPTSLIVSQLDRVIVHMQKESSIDWTRISTHCNS